MRPAISNEKTHQKHESRRREPVRFLVRARIVVLDVDGERTIRVPLQIIAAAERVAIDGVVDGVANKQLFPGCTYCSPQIASVGLTEQAAKEQKFDIRVGSLSIHGQRQGNRAR
jgi:hypothetical protein